MTNRQYEEIINDNMYLKIVYSTPNGNKGLLFMKESLFLLKRKTIEKRVKDCLWYIYHCTKTEFLMHSVAILYKRMKAEKMWREKLGYKRIWLDHGYEWRKDYD